MLSQHHRSLEVGCDDRTGARPHRVLALPPHPQVLLSSISPALQHQLGVFSPLPTYHSQRHATACEYGLSRSTQPYSPQPKTKKVGRRGMMNSTTRSTSVFPAGPVQLPLLFQESTSTPFTFIASPKPDMVLSFPPRPSPPRIRKRCRPLTDVDGELSCLHKKKRRLRLFLITSRLSPEFSHPATNIVDRGSSKIAVWAKQKALGRNLLRKAAILNRIRRRAILKEMDADVARVHREHEQQHLALAKLALMYESHDTRTRPVVPNGPSLPPTAALRISDHFEVSEDPSPPPSPRRSSSPPNPDESDEAEVSTYQSPNDAYSYSPPRAQLPRRSYLPLPRSPLGLSNYDALDLEDDIPNPYAHLEDEEEDRSVDPGEDMGDDPDSPSANTLASHSTSLSTVSTCNSGILKTPSQLIYSDFNYLEPGEPVVGDYDQVDEGAEAIWPNALAGEASSPPPNDTSPTRHAQPPASHLPASSSPNFAVLFGASKEEQTSHDRRGNDPDGSMIPAKKEMEMEQERARQKSLMFLHFNS